DIVPVAAAARDAGAEAVTLVNTLPAMTIDVDRCRPYAAGLSGAAIHPVAVRAVHDVHAALADLPIVGAGGVTDARPALALLPGAAAVEVGTATFADPRAPWRVRDDLVAWCRRAGVTRMCDLVGGAHGSA